MNGLKRIDLGIRTIFYVILLIKTLESFVMFKHGDPFNYHLTIGKFILNDGLFKAYSELCSGAQSGLFEFAYLFPISLLGPNLLAQLICQFIHFIFSLGLGSMAIIKKIDRHSTFAYLGAIALLTPAIGGDFFLYAKNDGVIALIGLFLAIHIIEKDRLNGIFIGSFFGILVAIKLSAVFIIVPLYLFAFFKCLKSKNILALLPMTLLPILFYLPFLLRNFLLWQSPFFPGFTHLFPGTLTPEMISYYRHSMNAPITPYSIKALLKIFFSGKIIFAVAPVLFLLDIHNNKNNRLYYLISLFMFILYCVVNGGVAEPRFIFIVYFLNIYFIFASLDNYQHQIKFNKKLLILGILALVLFDSKIDNSIKRIYKTAKLYSSGKDELQIINDISPNTKIWNHTIFYELAQDHNPIKILSDEFTEIYYAPSKVRLDHYECSPDASFLVRCENELTFINRLKRYPLAILSKRNVNLCYHIIQAKGKILSQVDNYTLYDLRPIYE